MNKLLVIFPHQLFKNHPGFKDSNEIVLIEEFLFFRQYPFHKSKLAYHRACMKFYQSYLISEGFKVTYIESNESISDIRIYLDSLDASRTHLIYADTCDNWLQKRIRTSIKKNGISSECIESPLFLNTNGEIIQYSNNQKRFYQTDFYIKQRKQKKLLIDRQENPVGGKWSFDSDNRLKFPKNQKPPKIQNEFTSVYLDEAINYINENFSNNPGTYDLITRFPHTFDQADIWLDEFVATRLRDFGIYEDAMLENEPVINHGLLTPALNCGLLSPHTVIEKVIQAHDRDPDIPLNSVEGFIRQICGWREFIRMVYVSKGSKERTRNFWGHSRKIPETFWTGETGIRPIDIVIKRILKNAYCHHIERLMVLGNFMLLCEFDPDEVYEWFMSLFIDAYDWVMVPNVYGMSQFADGGLMATKPYISGSNYLKKMSDFKTGEWTEIWDALFWRFISKQRKYFESNPRSGMMVRTWEKMDEAKKQSHLSTAENFLEKLSLYSSN